MKTVADIFRFLITIPFIPVLILIAAAAAIWTLIFGKFGEPTSLVRRITTTAILAGIVAFFVYANSRQSVTIHTWASPKECYDEHIRVAEGAFTTENEDNPCDLIRHCEWAFETGAYDLSDMAQNVRWEFAVKMGPDHRKERIAAYFAPSKDFRDISACNSEFTKDQERAREERINDVQQTLVQFEQIELCGPKGPKPTPQQRAVLERYITYKTAYPEEFEIAQSRIKTISRETLCAGYQSP